MYARVREKARISKAWFEVGIHAMNDERWDSWRVKERERECVCVCV